MLTCNRYAPRYRSEFRSKWVLIYFCRPLFACSHVRRNHPSSRSFWSRVYPTRPRPCPAALAVSRGARTNSARVPRPLCARVEGELRDALRAWFPRTSNSNCVIVKCSPPMNARSAGAGDACRLRAWRLAAGTRSTRAPREEVRIAVAASQRWYPADLEMWEHPKVTCDVQRQRVCFGD
jgi:hypothetical protein